MSRTDSAESRPDSDTVEPVNEIITSEQDVEDEEDLDQIRQARDESRAYELVNLLENDLQLREPLAKKITAFVNKPRISRGDLLLIADQVEAYKKVRDYDLDLRSYLMQYIFCCGSSERQLNTTEAIWALIRAIPIFDSHTNKGKGASQIYRNLL